MFLVLLVHRMFSLYFCNWNIVKIIAKTHYFFPSLGILEGWTMILKWTIVHSVEASRILPWTCHPALEWQVLLHNEHRNSWTFTESFQAKRGTCFIGSWKANQKSIWPSFCTRLRANSPVFNLAVHSQHFLINTYFIGLCAYNYTGKFKINYAFGYWGIKHNDWAMGMLLKHTLLTA